MIGGTSEDGGLTCVWDAGFNDEITITYTIQPDCDNYPYTGTAL